MYFNLFQEGKFLKKSHICNNLPFNSIILPVLCDHRFTTIIRKSIFSYHGIATIYYKTKLSRTEILNLIPVQHFFNFFFKKKNSAIQTFCFGLKKNDQNVNNVVYICNRINNFFSTNYTVVQ